MSVSPALNLFGGESSVGQPLEPHWIEAAPSDHQLPLCWTSPVHGNHGTPMFKVTSPLLIYHTMQIIPVAAVPELYYSSIFLARSDSVSCKHQDLYSYKLLNNVHTCCLI